MGLEMNIFRKKINYVTDRKIFKPGQYELSMRYKKEPMSIDQINDPQHSVIVSNKLILTVNRVNNWNRAEYNDFYLLGNNEVELDLKFLNDHRHSVYYDQVFSHMLGLLNKKNNYAFPYYLNDDFQDLILYHISKYPESYNIGYYIFQVLTSDYINHKSQKIKDQTITKLRNLLTGTEGYKGLTYILNNPDYLKSMKRYEINSSIK